MRRVLLVLSLMVCSAAAFAQAGRPKPAHSDAAGKLQDAADLTREAAGSPKTGKAVGDAVFDGAVGTGSESVAVEDVQPIVTVKPKEAGAQEFGEGPGDGNDGEEEEDSEIGRIIKKVLKSKQVREALDEVRKEQSEKFAKEVVDNVAKDPRLKKIMDGPSKTKSIVINSAIGGGGALMAGLGFALGISPLGFLGLGILAAGLIGLAITWLF